MRRTVLTQRRKTVLTHAPHGRAWDTPGWGSSQSQQTTRRLHFGVTLSDRDPQSDRRTASVETRG